MLTQDLSTQEAGAGINYPENVRTAMATGDPVSKTKRKKAEKGQGSGHPTPWTPDSQLPSQCSCALQVNALSENRGAQSGDVDYNPAPRKVRVASPNLSSPVTSKSVGAT